MGVSARTEKKHRKTWNSTMFNLSGLFGDGEPEDYFRRYAAQFDTSNFLQASRRGKKSRGGLDLAGFYMKVGEELIFAAQKWCDETVEWMVANHMWENRTGDAESGLNATIAGITNAGQMDMFLYHSVEYGVYLETVVFTRKGFVGVINGVDGAMYQRTPLLLAELQGVLNQ